MRKHGFFWIVVAAIFAITTGGPANAEDSWEAESEDSFTVESAPESVEPMEQAPVTDEAADYGYPADDSDSN